MRPLILWARDHTGTLRLAEHTAAKVSGQFVQADRITPFQFDLQTRRLTLGVGASARIIQLNEHGWEEN
jgi:hypothetical protein